jgi:hypothetical protein
MNVKGNRVRIENPSNIYFFQHVIAKRYKKTNSATSWEKNTLPQKTL